jgi:Aspartyl protease
VKLAAILIAATLAAPALSQPAPGPEPQRVVHQQRPPPPVMTGTRADLPLEMVAGLPTIAAMVNGRGPYRFGIDTGAAGYLRLKPALAEALGLQAIGEVRAGDPSGRNPITLPLYRVESLAFGGLTFTGVVTTPLTLGGPRGAADVDGIIGIGFFEHLLLTIDYGALRFSAAPGALPAANGCDIVDATLERGLISVPIAIGSVRQNVHLDTGNAAQSLAVPAEAVAGLPTAGEPRVVGRARTVSQEIVIGSVALAAPVTIGTTVLPVTSIGFPAPAPPGNLGSRGLSGMALTIDYANARVRIVPSAAPHP